MVERDRSGGVSRQAVDFEHLVGGAIDLDGLVCLEALALRIDLGAEIVLQAGAGREYLGDKASVRADAGGLVQRQGVGKLHHGTLNRAPGSGSLRTEVGGRPYCFTTGAPANSGKHVFDSVFQPDPAWARKVLNP
jgi:hypothetical protein